MKAKTGSCEGRKIFGQTEAERETLARMHKLAAKGLNYTEIASALNAEHRKTRLGKEWFPTTVSRTLANKQATQ